MIENKNILIRYNKMQQLSVTGYPRNLSYCVKKLSGFSRHNFKLMTLNQNSCINGNILSVDLPSNSLIDLSTLTMFFNLTTTTTAGFAATPRNVECLIERIETEISAQIIGSSCLNYPNLWQAVTDTTCGLDLRNRRSVLQSGADVIAPVTANVNNVQYAIQSFLGVTSSISPNILDSSLVGNIRLRITFSNPNVLAGSAGVAGMAFSLSNIFLSVDTIDIADNLFHPLHEQFLASGGIHEMPFNSYVSYSSVRGLSQTTKFSLSTQSFNRVWAMFLPGQASKIASIGTSSGTVGSQIDPISKASSYFTRVCGGNQGVAITYGDATNSSLITYNLTGYQFSINNVFSPNWQPSGEQSFAMMMNSYQLSQDTIGGIHPGLNSLTAWLSSYWLAEARFDLGYDGVALISGSDTRGSTAQMYFQSYGTITPGAVTGTGDASFPGTSLMCQVFAQCTSTLRVGQGRQIGVIM